MTVIFHEDTAFRKNGPRGRMSSRKRTFLTGTVLLFTTAMLVFALVVALPKIMEVIGGTSGKDYSGRGRGEVTVTVPAGSNGAKIGEILLQKDVVASAEAFVSEFKNNPRANSIRAGSYRLRKKMSAANALAALLDPASRAEIRITIPEGFTKAQAAARIARLLKISPQKVKDAMDDAADIGLPAESGGNIEGWIAPLTYEFAPDTDVKSVLKKMVSCQVKKLEKAGVDPGSRQRVLTVASIVEREVSWHEYYGKVARVIENRLKSDSESHGLLQMDSTVMYGVGKTSGIPGADDLANDNPYNTYIHPGLPPAPISSPGADAIRAAANPTPGDWLYFVTVNLDSGETQFTTTLSEHQKYVQEFKDWYAKNRK